MPFAQLVVGPPGSGKTSYCAGLSQFLPQLSRPVSVVNLDPANTAGAGGYVAALDINALVSVRDVMGELGLGPNGATLYALEYLEANVDWLVDGLRAILRAQRDAGTPPGSEYLVFDLPGQVELSTTHTSLCNILATLHSRLDLRSVVVHLADATHIADPARYIALTLLALRAMLTLQLPHINVLSKVDLLATLDPADLPFNLDFYTNVQDLTYLTPHISNPHPRLAALTQTLADLVEDFALVHFATLAVQDKQSMMRLVRTVDKAVGYIYETQGTGTGTGTGTADPFSVVDTGDPLGWGSAEDVQERYMPSLNSMRG